jgi:hypothetical protein
LKLFQEYGGGEIKENDGGGEFRVIYCKNFCKCHNVPPEQQLKREKKEKQNPNPTQG